MKADARTEAAVMSTLNRLIEAHVSRDMDSVLVCFAPDPDLVYIGTGVGEKRLGLNEVRVRLDTVRDSINRAWVELGLGSRFGWHG